MRVEIGVRDVRSVHAFFLSPSLTAVQPASGKELCAFQCAPHWPLLPDGAELFLHPKRDLIAMRLENEGAFLASLATMGLTPCPLKLDVRACLFVLCE